MSALTYEIKGLKSPVTRWLRATFPHHREVQTAYRLAAGPALVLPSPAVATGTQGAAIDWWLRMLVDPEPSVGLALAGLRTGLAPGAMAAVELMEELGAIDSEKRIIVGSIQPSRFADCSDQWWARVCYALALLVELYRSPRVESSRLMRLHRHSHAADLLALANDDEVADLIAMRDLARQRLLPALPGGRVATGSTFDGSADLNADADLIAGGMLVDFKATQGKARTDGTRTLTLDRTDLDQLLGYALMDYSDSFALHSVAIYATRYGHLATWPLAKLCTQLAGRTVDLPTLRQQFAQVLRHELPGSRRSQQLSQQVVDVAPMAQVHHEHG